MSLKEEWEDLSDRLDGDFPAYDLVRLEQFLREHRPWAAAYLTQAHLLRGFRQFQEARWALRNAEATLGGPHSCLKEAEGLIYFDAGRHGLAQRFFRQALELDPREMWPRLWLGRSYRLQGKLEESERWLRSLRGRPNAPREPVALEMGYIFRAQEQWSRARRWFRSAGLEGLESLQDLEQFGTVSTWSKEELRRRQGGPVTQLAAARHLERLEPEWGAAYSNQALALAELNRLPEALKQVSRWRGLMGEHPAGPRLQAMVLHTAGRHERAARLWLQLAADSSDTEPWIYAGSCLARLGRLEEAEECHRQATQRIGCPDEGMYNLALVLRAQGRYAESLECARRTLDMDDYWDGPAVHNLVTDLEKTLAFWR